ncbi:Clp protease ClpB [Bacillus sp. AFS073361]|uniref:phage scaffolding protein n=1 Tax=Bacillus sp. AFS073361 TaxID=2033511 RepID=UPI000BF2BF98|nr:Clp protease ClpB [Bacillus sp. AFS073361]PFP30251.1 Clp protease ClpB [Bacillus sp. AFS073361]
MSEELNQNPEVVTENPTVEEPENKPEVKTVTMTQDELNALISKEKGRVKSKYADYDDIKTKASEYEKALEEKRLAELSEKERLEEIAKKYDEEKQSLAKELELLRESNKNEKIRNAFITKAQAAGIGYVDDAYQLSSKLLSAVKVDEEGVHGVDEIISELITNKPFLLAQTKKQQKPIGEPSNNSVNEEIKTLEAQLADAKKAKNFAKVIELSNLIASKK